MPNNQPINPTQKTDTMRTISFELTMPNVGSWNGKWTGAENKYYVIEKISDRYLNSKEYFKTLLERGWDSWYYNFGDGWGQMSGLKSLMPPKPKKERKCQKGLLGTNG